MPNTDPVAGKLLDYGGAVFNVRHPAFANSSDSDDTGAIQRAFNAASAALAVIAPTSGGGSYVGSAPVVYFPAGHYTISGEITAGAYINVVSDSGAIVEQTSASLRHLVFTGGYTVQVDGLKFVGGTTAIDFRNANVDSSYLRICNCEFQRTQSYAVYTFGTASASDVHMSCVLTIEQCKFIDCRQVLHNVCDSAVVTGDTWVRVSAGNFAANSAAFVNRAGTLRLDGMFGVPLMGTGTGRPANVRWVDLLDGELQAIGSRFGGEDAGMGIVWVLRPTASAQAAATDYPFIGSTVSIRDSWVASGPDGAADTGVVHLRTSVPQRITYVDNQINTGPMIVNSGGVDLDAYFDSIPYTQQRFRFTLPGVAGVPAQLLLYTNFIDYSRRLDAVPTTGRWVQGQMASKLTPGFGKPAGYACVADGSPAPGASTGACRPSRWGRSRRDRSGATRSISRCRSAPGSSWRWSRSPPIPPVARRATARCAATSSRSPRGSMAR